MVRVGNTMDRSRSKPQPFIRYEGSSDEPEITENNGSPNEPEIEVRVSNGNILMKIHCRKQKGILSKLLGKVESLNMIVVSTGVTAFGISALDVTIIAELENGFSLTVKEVAAALRASFLSNED